MALAKIRSMFVDFISGLDQLTPSWKTTPGSLQDSSNYEISIEGGYEDVVGYERFDGQAKPTAAAYAVLDVTISGSFSVSDTITQLVSGATGVVLAVDTSTRDPQDYLVITKITGTFDAANDLQVSTVTQGNADSLAIVDGANTNKLHSQYKNLAADSYRADITAVPGEGDILGLWMLDDTKYAFLNVTSWGTVNLDSGGSGSVDGITVNSIEIMSGAESFDTSLATTAAAVAANINAYTSSPNYTANAVGELIRIRALAENSFTVVSSTTTISSTDVNMSGHGSTTELYKHSASGWTLVPLGFELAFTSGGTSYTPSEGDVIEGETGGATATLTRIMFESGSWDGGDAVGKFIFAVQSGTFEAETVKVGANLDVASIAADSGSIVLLADGRYEFDNSNFGGESGAKRAYGCDTVNRGFEFDGSVFCPIKTGMTVDKPTHVKVHRNHLFFSFDGSAQHSGIGTPYIWDPIFGAAELATGDTITGFMTEPGSEGNSTLGIYNANRIHMLYGTSNLDWNLVRYREEIGAFAYTMQQVATTYFLGDRGISDIRTAQAFGNFVHATYSRKIQTLINQKKTNSSASCIARDKNQYRVFFTDNTGIYVTVGSETTNKIVGMMPVELKHPVKCMFSLETNSGNEEIFFGSSNGFVYQMEKGTSFDGQKILAFFKTHYDYQKALRIIKKYHDVALEAKGEGYAEFNITHELNYNKTTTPQPPGVTIPMDLSSASRWDIGNWDSGFWDGTTLSPASNKLSGSGQNISITILKDSDYFSPIRFSGALFNYSLRRRMRNE